MSGRQIAVGSRGSALALAQAKLVCEALGREQRVSRIVVIETEGDRRAPETAWGEGAFVAAIERELLDGRIDVAVHSAKDVPTEEDPRLRIGAYLPRADPRDALVVRTDAAERRLADLVPGSRVGTDSPRRTGFLLAHRPDLTVHPIHGNVDTRLRRLDAGETDALILACAGLDRMGLGDRIAERLEPNVVPPAPGQGAIAVQIRSDDARMLAVAAAMDDRRTRDAVEAERALLIAAGGGCRSPLGALATILDDGLELVGGYASPDGSEAIFARTSGPVTASDELARHLANSLDTRARLHEPTSRVAPVRDEISPRVIVTRAAEQAQQLVSALQAAGLFPVRVPTIEVEFEPPGMDLETAAGRRDGYRWIVLTSANGARAIIKAAARVASGLGTPAWAAIGPATRRVLEDGGLHVDFEPSHSSAAAMARELPVRGGDRVLVVRGDLAGGLLAVALRRRGAAVDDVVGYRTREAPESSRGLLRAATAAGPIAAVTFTSGSTVRGLLSLGQRESIDVRSFPAVCVGAETAAQARAGGFRILAVSPTPDSAALAAATANALALQSEETS